MDLYILDKDYQVLYILDEYESLVWTERYNDHGDFVIRINTNHPAIPFLIPRNYLWKKDSQRLMVIENWTNTTGLEEMLVTIEGRDLGLLLTRRQIYNTTQFYKSTPKFVIETLFRNCLLTQGTGRYVPNLTFHWDISDEDNEKFDESFEFNGKSLYEAIVEVCEYCEFGWKLILTDELKMEFHVYKGEDRSFEQKANKWIVYSTKFNNLISSEYQYKDENWYNAIVGCGEEASTTQNPTTGEIYDWPQVWFEVELEGAEQGFQRREMFFDGRNVSRWQGDYYHGGARPPEDVTHGWKKLPAFVYRSILITKAKESLKDNHPTHMYSAELDPTMQWQLGRDIFMGDIVQIVDDNGIEDTVYIAEIIYSHDRSGSSVYPTFVSRETFPLFDFTESEEEGEDP